MTAKEYLQGIRGQRDLLAQANEDYLAAVARATSISSSLDSRHSGDLAERLVHMDNFAARRKAEAERLEALWQEAYEKIMQLPDVRHQCVLIRYYLRAETFEQVAVRMNYSYYHVCHLHGNALQAFGIQHRAFLKAGGAGAKLATNRN